MTGLFDLDEGFYGAITAEMNRRGEWITPYYNGSPWFEKPILTYWLAKPALALFGDQFGPRLPNVLCTLATYALVGWFARRRFSEDVAVLAVLVIGSSLLMAGPGRMMLTDPALVLCLTGAFITFWESLVRDPRWRVATAALLGLSVLAKGPVGLILFVPLAVFTFWREPELRPRFRGWWLVGTVVLALVIASWYLPAYLVNRDVFVQKFLIEQNLERFTGGDKAHTLGGFASLVFFLPILLVGMLPWSLWIPKSLTRTGGVPLANAALNRYLAAWAIIVFAFFTISGAKLIHYIMPCVPPLAILVADRLIAKKGTLTPGLLRAAVVWTLVMTLITNGGFYAWYRSSGQEEAHALARRVAKTGENVAVYQMGRREASMGTGGTRLKETSLPSLYLYLNRTALDTDDLTALVLAKKPMWVITRKGRFSPEDMQRIEASGQSLESFPTNHSDPQFELYRMDHR